MMILSEKDRLFVERRSRVVRAWPFVGVFMVVLLIGLGLWLYVSVPLLANPLFVMEQIKGDAIPKPTVALMAAMLPVVVLLSIGLSALVVVFVFVAISNEKRYLRLIEGGGEAGKPGSE